MKLSKNKKRKSLFKQEKVGDLYVNGSLELPMSSYYDMMSRKPKFIYLPSKQIMQDIIVKCALDFANTQKASDMVGNGEKVLITELEDQ